MKTNQILKICLLMFVFLLAFSIGAQSVRNQIEYEKEQASNPVRQYMRENYGVDYIEEYQAKLKQEVWLNFTNSVKQQFSDEECLNDWKQKLLETNEYGTSTQQSPVQANAYTWLNLVSVNPFVDLSAFSLSGLSFTAMLMIPKFGRKLLQKKWLIAFVIVAFIFYAGFMLGKTIASPSFPPNLYLDSLPSTASYVIETDGTYYWAMKDTGQIVYGGASNAGGVNGTVASSVIQAVLDAVRISGGGRVFIKDGTYVLKSMLKIGSNTVLEGESWQTILQMTADVQTEYNDATIRNYNAYNTNIDSNIVIKNLQISGGETATFANYDGGAILFAGVVDSLIDHVYAHGYRHHLIRIASSPTWGACSRVTVQNCLAKTVGYNGIHFEGEPEIKTTDSLAIGNYATDCDVGICAYGASYTLIVGNVVWNIFNSYVQHSKIDIVLEDHATRCAVIGNTVRGRNSDRSYDWDESGIVTLTNSSDNLIANNLIEDKDFNGIGISTVNNIVVGNFIRQSTTNWTLQKGIEVNSGGNIVSDNVIEGGHMSMGIEAEGSDNLISNNIIRNNQLWYGGIRFYGQRNFIKNNRIYEDTLGSLSIGFRLENTSSDNVLEGNILRNLNTGIKIYSGASNNQIYRNYFLPTLTTIISDAGTGTKVKYNIGYVTENSGTATITASTSVTVNHGL
ncbi:MAG: right-handed parallel beta-helix repeat-containing protein, partial [Candidatus Bathycorpusculaceae bacterium]